MSFLSPEEEALAAAYLDKGYVIEEAQSLDALNAIKRVVCIATGGALGKEIGLLEETLVPREILNDLKLKVMRDLEASWVRPAYYSLARDYLAALAGNELAMQRRLNLSVQMPGDDSALLPLHADTWTGDSPFEVVLWVPLVDCKGTQSMFFRDHFIEIEYGKVLLFDPAIPHGNVMNKEIVSRWSLNCRFKGLFTPYADKKLGAFFEPITLKAASIAGLR